MTLDCLHHLRRPDVAGETPIILVDNGSTSQDRDQLRAGLPANVTLLQNTKNLGYAGGMNVGLRYALNSRCEYIWLVNNDAFPHPFCLEKLTARLQKDLEVAIVGPKLVYPDGERQYELASIDWETGIQTFCYADQFEYKCQEHYILIGVAPLIRAQVLREVGIFDPGYFAYREDDELCTRIIETKRWRLQIESSATCSHIQGASTNGDHSPSALVLFLMTRNGWRYMRKYTLLRRRPRLLLRYASIIVLESLRHRRGGHINFASALLGALWAILLNRSGKPNSLRAPTFFESFLLKFGWGVSRIAWRLSNHLGPRSSYRAPPHARNDGRSYTIAEKR